MSGPGLTVCDVPCTWEAELGGMLPVPELVGGGGAGGGGRGEVGARLRVAQPPGPGAHNLQHNEIFFKKYFHFLMMK